jgi:Protein of unknown function, DUF481
MDRRKWTGACLLVTLCAVSGTALADWKGKGELGASLATGNSENESANAALEMKHTRDKWTNTFGFAGNYGSDGTVTTAERWELRAQSDYAFTDRAYWFGRPVPGRERIRQYLSTERSWPGGDDHRLAGAAAGVPGAAQHRRAAGHREDRYSRHRRIALRNQVSSQP